MVDSEQTKPEPPDGLAKYLSDGLKRQDPEVLNDIRHYSEDLAEYVKQPPVEIDDLAADDERLIQAVERGQWTEVRKLVSCGKDCSGCPHGPYIYLVRRASSAKLEWKYIGPVSEYGDMFPGGEDDESYRVSDELMDDEQKKRLDEIGVSEDDIQF